MSTGTSSASPASRPTHWRPSATWSRCPATCSSSCSDPWAAVCSRVPARSAALIGGARQDTQAPIDLNTLLFGRTVRGIIQGDSISQLFIPQLIEMYRAGDFPFDRLVRFYEFDEINQAVADTRSGIT